MVHSRDVRSHRLDTSLFGVVGLAGGEELHSTGRLLLSRETRAVPELGRLSVDVAAIAVLLRLLVYLEDALLTVFFLFFSHIITIYEKLINNYSIVTPIQFHLPI